MSRSARTTVGFSVVLSDRDRIRAAAARYGLSVSAYCLHAVMERVQADEAVKAFDAAATSGDPGD